MRDTNDKRERDSIRKMVRDARRDRLVSRKSVGLLVTALIASLVFSGMAAAVVFKNTTVTQTNGSYSGTQVGPANWPTAPGLGVVVSASSTCQTSGTFNAATASATTFTIGLNGSTPTCAVGDFSERFVYPPATTLTSKTETFTFASTWIDSGNGSLSGAVTFTLTVVGGTASGAGLDFVCDYGSAAFPLQVTTLNSVAA